MSDTVIGRAGLYISLGLTAVPFTGAGSILLSGQSPDAAIAQVVTAASGGAPAATILPTFAASASGVTAPDLHLSGADPTVASSLTSDSHAQGSDSGGGFDPGFGDVGRAVAALPFTTEAATDDSGASTDLAWGPALDSNDWFVV